MLKKNIIGLTWIQIFNIGAPLITIPLLISGMETVEYAKYTFYLSVTTFIAVFSDLGISNISVNIISRVGENDKKQEIFEAILSLKIIALAVIAIFAYVFLVCLFPGYYEIELFCICMLGGAGLSLAPTFYLVSTGQILVQAKFLSIARVASVLILVYIYQNGINAKAGLLLTYAPVFFTSFILTFYIYNRAGWLSFKIKLSNMVRIFMDVKIYILTNGLVWVYTSSGPLIVAKFYGIESVALYGVLDKILVATKSILNPLLQSLQPWVVSVIDASKVEYLNKLKKSIIICFVTGLVIGIFVNLCGVWIIGFLTNEVIQVNHYILIPISMLPLVTGLSWVYGNLVLVPNRKLSEYFFSITFGFLIYVLPLPLLANTELITFLYLQLSVEVLVLICMYRFTLKSDLKNEI